MLYDFYFRAYNIEQRDRDIGALKSHPARLLGIKYFVVEKQQDLNYSAFNAHKYRNQVLIYLDATALNPERFRAGVDDIFKESGYGNKELLKNIGLSVFSGEN